MLVALSLFSFHDKKIRIQAEEENTRKYNSVVYSIIIIATFLATQTYLANRLSRKFKGRLRREDIKKKKKKVISRCLT